MSFLSVNTEFNLCMYLSVLLGVNVEHTYVTTFIAIIDYARARLLYKSVFWITEAL